MLRPEQPFENQLPRSDFEAARTWIREIAEKPGVMFMSKQTYYQLKPEHHRDRESAQVAEDGSVRRFRWRNRDVVVPEAWSLSMLGSAAGFFAGEFDFGGYQRIIKGGGR